jgi:hypothetical protein
MKKRTAVVFLSLAIAAGLVASAPGQNFSCGGGLLTYAVQSTTDVAPNPHVAAIAGAAPGIRCVKYYPQGPTAFIWYGEGKWDQKAYRHIGIATRTGGGGELGVTAKAGDFAGEGFQGGVVLLTMQADTNGQNLGPVTVTSSWKETWIPVAQAIYTPLPKPTSCGENFFRYKVHSNAQSGTGMRCVLRLAHDSPFEGDVPFTTVWFGNGQWKDQGYSHIGRLNITSAPQNVAVGTGDATDICDGRFGTTCWHADLNSIRFEAFTCLSSLPPPPPPTPVGRNLKGYNVGGAWNEVWTLADPAPQCRQ